MMIRMPGTTHENLEAIRGLRLQLGRVCILPVLRCLLSIRRHLHRDGAVKGTQRFFLRRGPLIRELAVAVAHVSRLRDACADVIVQIAGQVQHQMSSAIPVRIGLTPELLVRKRIHPFVQMGCNIFVICCQPRSYRFVHLCHERGPLCSHPTGYLDELQLRRVYSISQNADNSLPRAKVKAALRRSCNSRESGPKTMPQLFNPDWVCTRARGESIEFRTCYVPHGKYSEILPFAPGPRMESFLESLFYSCSPPHFSTTFGRGSFRTIDPVTTPRRNWVQDGSLLLLSRPSRGGAISRRPYPSARLGAFRGLFRPFYLSPTEFRDTRTAQAAP